MSLAMAAFIYVLIWWVMLFTVLPFGVSTHQEHGLGYDAGAPSRPGMGKKMLVNTLVSAVILGIIQVLVVTGVLDWDAFFEGAWK